MPYYEPPLDIWSAAERGLLSKVQDFAASGADINGKARGGATPLHSASEAGHLALVKWLIENGADVNARTIPNKGDEGSFAPLHLAARRGQLGVVRALVACGARVDARMSDGTTPLMLAAEVGNQPMVCLFLEAGAKVDDRNHLGQTAFAIAVFNRRHPTATCLLAKGAQIDARMSPYGITALMAVAGGKLIQETDSLIKAGANIFLVDEQGMTALHHAALGAAANKVEWVKTQKGTQVDRERPEDAVQVVNLLLQAGADPGVRDNDGFTALDWARKVRLLPLIERLEQARS